MSSSVYYKHEGEKTHSSFFLISFFCIFVCAALLGSLRLYGLYLERRISETNSRIEQQKEDNLEMSKHFSELLSPARIYSYAREELGMMNAENIMTVRLTDSSIGTEERAAVQVSDSGSSFFDYINPFISRAHAKN